MWVHTCPHCGYEQVLDYEKNIVCNNPKGIDEIGRIVQPGTFSFVCQKCGGILDRWYDGQWVAMAPSIGRAHGYQISQLDAVWVSADDLKRKELQAPSKQFFYNYVIGKPYEDSTSKFYDSDVLDHRRDYLPEQQKSRGRYDWISAGIDWGEHYHNIVIMGMLPNGNIDIIGLKSVRRSEGVNELERDLHQVMAYLDQFNPDLIVPDFGYNGNYNDKLSQAFGTDKVYSCIVKSAKSQNDYKAHFDLSNHRVTIDKLMQNVMMLNNMKRDSIGFYKKVDPALKLFMQHWSNVVIRTDIDDDAPDPDTIVKTITRKGGDHLAQSSVYAMVGMNHLVELIKQRKDSQLFTSSLSTYTKVPDSEKTDLQEELFNSSLM